MRKGTFISVFLAIIALSLIGVGIGLAVHPTATQIKNEVRPIELIQLGATLLVGVVVQQYLSKRSGESRVEKNLVIDQINKVIAQLDGARESFHACCADPASSDLLQKLVRALKSVAVQLLLLDELVAECAFNKIEILGPTRTTLLRAYRQATTASFPNEPSEKDQIAAERTHEKIVKHLTVLAVRINRA